MADETIEHDPTVITPEGQQFLDDLRARLLKLAAESPDVDYDPERRGGGAGRCETEIWRGYTYCKHSVPKLRKLAIIIGAYLLKMLQGSYSTSTSASANTHGGGGAGDVVHWNWTEAIDNWVMNLARDVCLLVYWDRDAISGVWADHGHWIDPHCPNLSPEAAAQVVDFYWNRNGLANDGPDFGSRKSVAKIWDAYKNRSSTTVAKIEALMFPTSPTPAPVPEEDDMPYSPEQIKAMFREVIGEENTAVQIHTGHAIVKNPRDPDGERVTPSFLWENSTWLQQVTRDGARINVLDELVSVLTTLRAFNVTDMARDNRMNERIEDLHDALGAKISLVLDAITGTEPPPPPPPPPPPADPEFLLGYDMSGHQSVAQVADATGTTDFGIIKITEGYAFRNSKEDDQVAAVRTANDLVGMYHFAWLSQDPVKELDHFMTQAQIRPGELPCLDLENWGTSDPNHPLYAEHKAMRENTPWTQRVDYAVRWLTGCESLCGARAPWYVNWDWMRNLRTAATVEQWETLCRFPVWIAQPVKNLTSKGTSGVEGVDWRWRQPGEFDSVSPKTGSDVAPYVLLHQYKTVPHDMNWLHRGKQNWLQFAAK